MATIRSRYHNYSYPPPADSSASMANSCPASSTEGRNHQRQGLGASNGITRPPAVALKDPQARPNTSSRLEYIINAMAYIRGELDDLKESDRVLLEIFKHLESNVAELSDSISSWKTSGNTASPGRPISFTEFDFDTSRSSYCTTNSPHTFNGLETILDSSKEDISYKASSELDSLSLTEQESSSTSCSPVLMPLKSHASVPSINSASGGSSSSGGGARRPANPSPQLKTSTSFNSRLAHSPSITRLQDETGSNISRNSSIDSGIQFASEAENGSANGVEVVQSTPAESEETETDVRKSVGFADDIFAALGMK